MARHQQLVFTQVMYMVLLYVKSAVYILERGRKRGNKKAAGMGGWENREGFVSVYDEAKKDEC